MLPYKCCLWLVSWCNRDATLANSSTNILQQMHIPWTHLTYFMLPGLVWNKYLDTCWMQFFQKVLQNYCTTRCLLASFCRSRRPFCWATSLPQLFTPRCAKVTGLMATVASRSSSLLKNICVLYTAFSASHYRCHYVGLNDADYWNRTAFPSTYRFIPLDFSAIVAKIKQHDHSLWGFLRRTDTWQNCLRISL